MNDRNLPFFPPPFPLLLVLSLLGGCAGSRPTSVEPVPEPGGEALYATYCSPCHGPEGRGDGPLARDLEMPPADLAAGRFRLIDGDGRTPRGAADLRRMLSGGWRSARGMPPFEFLDRRELDELAGHVLSLRRESGGEHPAPAGPVPPPPARLLRRRTAGLELYLSAGCATCHAAGAVRDSLLARGDPPLLFPSGDYPFTGEDRNRVFRIIRDGIPHSAMPGYRDALRDGDIWDLVFHLEEIHRAGRAEPSAKADPPADLAGFWRFPLAPQGEPDAGNALATRSLDPVRCGVCHTSQYLDWRESMHRQALSPGLLGQFLEQDFIPGDLAACQHCHAPLAEQSPGEDPTAERGDPFRFYPRPRLAHQGITCAGCHLRSWRRFGPPPTDRTIPPVLQRHRKVHGGATYWPSFESSGFCSPCHQFVEGEGLSLQGKLLQNTHREWQDSSYPERGITCQSCHMPGRRHLWKGIHDPGMTRKGLEIRFDPGDPAVPAERPAVLTLTSIWIGHAFPTYVTPRVTCRIGYLDENGDFLPGFHQRDVIGRSVTLGTHAMEWFDTRLLPGETRKYRFDLPPPDRAVAVGARIRVEPDHFYTGFYEEWLAQDTHGRASREMIRRALERTHDSAYLLFEEIHPLPEKPEQARQGPASSATGGVR